MKKKIFSILLVLTLAISLFGCAASENSAMDKNEIGGFGNSNDSMSNGIYDTPSMEMAPPSPESPSVENGKTESTESYIETQKLIYKCEMNIETLEFEKTTSTIKSLIKKHGGFVESDSMYDDSWDWYHSDYKKHSATMREVIKIRIPTNNYDKFLNEVDGIAKIRNKNESVTNITKSYNDTKTTIAMYEQEEQMLLNMMSQATSISDMLEVEQRLAEVQRKLAIYKSNMNSMETDLAFSTISVEIQEVVQYTTNKEEMSFGARFLEAVKESFNDFVSFIQGFIIVIVHVAPYLITLSICAAIAVYLIRRRRMKKGKPATMKIEKSATNDVQSDNKQ